MNAHILIIYLIVINILLFVMMDVDKKKSIKKRYRISEATLLFLGVFGGGMGGLLGMMIFRHKTKKPKFYAVFVFSIAVWIYLIWSLRDLILF